MSTRILVAGVGNVLRGDDGFGVELARRLAHRKLPHDARVIETGIGGMSLVQEVMSGCDALLILDAHSNGSLPGTVRLLEPTLPDLSALDAHAVRDYFADTHYATPMRALGLLERLGRLPPCVAVLGCEPAICDEMTIGLSEPVAKAVDAAERLVIEWIDRLVNPAKPPPP